MPLPAEPCLITTERSGEVVPTANAPDLSACLASVPPGGDIPAGHAEPPLRWRRSAALVSVGMRRSGLAPGATLHMSFPQRGKVAAAGSREAAVG